MFKSEEDQKKIASQLGYGLVTKFVTGTEGVQGIADKNKTNKKVILEKITKVTLTLDPENKISSNVGGAPGKDYEIALNNVTLFKYIQYLYNIGHFTNYC